MPVSFSTRLIRYSFTALLFLGLLSTGVHSYAKTQVVLQTSLGDITLELYDEKAPVSVANFLEYIDSGFYDGTIFHRVIPGFMIQGGGFNEKMVKKPNRSPIINESNNGVGNKRATISMARLPQPDSASSQFFINLVDNANLDGRPGRPGYSVFGKVIAGMDIVDKAARQRTGQFKQYANVPKTPIIITHAKRVEPAKAP